ncbi:ATP-binding cassette domain-containing protein [Sulfurimonas sediminis]|uniref:ATP-binding cassette domain-containing protein n=1 Tax=Sulfurimonas sediminis TaxID=2590020 RepID=A0A7M1B456_9BACT|nr:ATP-binding cassette domain-containing protein [Sulfurimonas sediminis]QOP44445.1 ATP-binding cassette domain-containing protein [Sulfurimonas sediminis]
MIHIDVTKTLHGAEGIMPLHVKLSIKEGEFVALGGKSGSGKTTLLRILAGLEEAQGKIKVHNTFWLQKNRSLPVQQREIGFVFQDYALFENMSVEKNLLFVNNDKKLAEHLLGLTELSSLKERYPNSLSGGQKQRVSICRALMKKPKILLLDEPLSALDPAMRTKLQNELLVLHKEFGTTSIMVSHDPSEIYRLASRVIMLQNGKIINDGAPKEVLLKTQGSQKFSFEGELLDIKKADVIYIAIVAIGQQLVEVVVSSAEAKNLQIGQSIRLSTKAFAPTLTQN